MFDCDDDVVVIALWIIAIGFVILAIDKTTRLNNSTHHPTNNFPQIPELQPPQQQSFNATYSEDQQFRQIQQQLRQLGNGLNELKQNLSS